MLSEYNSSPSTAFFQARSKCLSVKWCSWKINHLCICLGYTKNLLVVFHHWKIPWEEHKKAVVTQTEWASSFRSKTLSAPSLYTRCKALRMPSLKIHHSHLDKQYLERLRICCADERIAALGQDSYSISDRSLYIYENKSGTLCWALHSCKKVILRCSQQKY